MLKNLNITFSLHDKEMDETFQPQDPICVIRESVADFLNRNSRYDVAFENTCSSVYMKMNVQLFHRILENIFKNIVKHADATKLSISLRTVDSFFEMKISDNGKGASIQTLQRLNDQSQMPWGENGLGLLVVKQMVGMHGGTVHFSSCNGFIITCRFPQYENRQMGK